LLVLMFLCTIIQLLRVSVLEKNVFLVEIWAVVRIFRDYSEISLKVDDSKGVMDFEKIFGRCGVVHVEVGSGKGAFLLSEAKEKTGEDFLGIEWARRYYRYAVDRIGRWGLKNVRLVRADVADFIARHIGDNSVDCFHIYFPDPWPKKRHHKRRFFSVSNLQQMIRCLKCGGAIQISTDYAEYFDQIKQIVSSESRLDETEFVRPLGAEDGELVGTNYERKYIKDGRDIYTIAAKKIT